MGCERGCLLLSGQCVEQPGAPPYGPFVEIVEHAARQVQQEVRVVVSEASPEVATIVPGCGASIPIFPWLNLFQPNINAGCCSPLTSISRAACRSDWRSSC